MESNRSTIISPLEGFMLLTSHNQIQTGSRFWDLHLTTYFPFYASRESDTGTGTSTILQKPITGIGSSLPPLDIRISLANINHDSNCSRHGANLYCDRFWYWDDDIAQNYGDYDVTKILVH